MEWKYSASVDWIKGLTQNSEKVTEYNDKKPEEGHCELGNWAGHANPNNKAYNNSSSS